MQLDTQVCTILHSEWLFCMFCLDFPTTYVLRQRMRTCVSLLISTQVFLAWCWAQDRSLENLGLLISDCQIHWRAWWLSLGLLLLVDNTDHRSELARSVRGHWGSCCQFYCIPGKCNLFKMLKSNLHTCMLDMTSFFPLSMRKKHFVPTIFSLQYNIKVNTDFGTFISQLCYLLVVTLRNYLDSKSPPAPCLWTASIKSLQDNLLA